MWTWESRDCIMRRARREKQGVEAPGRALAGSWGVVSGGGGMEGTKTSSPGFLHCPNTQPVDFLEMRILWGNNYNTTSLQILF